MVVGSRGYGPMRHALLGSVSAKLMRTCPAPLLVVPRGGHVTGGAASEAGRRTKSSGQSYGGLRTTNPRGVPHEKGS